MATMLMKIFVVALIFSVFAIGSITLFSDLESTYEPNLSSEFNSTYEGFEISINKIVDTSQSKARGLTDRMSNSTTTTISTPENSLKAGAWGAISLLWNMPNMVMGLLGAISKYLGLPPFIIYMAIALMSVTIAIIIIRLIFAGKA